ncbi:MAG TPA: thioredoxin family protein [Elusimicrobiota bacterium]|nr:thioredoxin family protein [Elusimicrobiota bacterium]
MALVESVPLRAGDVLAPFSLKDPSGKPHDFRSLFGPKGLLVVFTCNHCPYAIAVWPRLVRLCAEAKSLGVGTAAVNPNIHPDYPEDAAPRMAEKIREWAIPFPYLVDETQETARAWKAQCTPDPYLLDAAGKLFYHGRIDDNWKDESAVKARDLADAIAALAAGRPAPRSAPPSMGCSIKWRR